MSQEQGVDVREVRRVALGLEGAGAEGSADGEEAAQRLWEEQRGG